MIEARNGLLGSARVTVTFDGSTVVIRRGLFSRTEARIPISRITMVGWEKHLASGGHIEFVAAGVDGKVPFTWWKTAGFEALRAAVDEKIAAA